VKNLEFLVSLTTDDNDYQQEQAAAAKAAAQRVGAQVSVISAGNDAITQSQQLLEAIQASPGRRPNAIIFEPVGSAMPQVARAAVAAGIGWVVLNRDVDYISDLRKDSQLPIFFLTSDHEEIGRIQGRQLQALLPNGGTVLYIQGPSGSSAAQQRAAGINETKPPNIQLRTLRAQWTEASSQQAVAAWLRLRTAQEARIDLVAAQDDSMANGARKAFQQFSSIAERERWLRVPFTGCDGMPQTGQIWVKSGLLAATIVIPPNAGLAVEMAAKALRTGSVPAERTITEAKSFPSIEDLSNRLARKAHSAG